MAMSTGRSITNQLRKKTRMLQLLLPSSSASSVKQFTTALPSNKKDPYFLLHLPSAVCSSCSRITLISKLSFFSGYSSSSQPNSLLSLHESPFLSSSSSSSSSSSQHNLIHGGSSSTVRNHDHLTASSIPVRAYFLSTSIDLKSLVDEYQVNFVPPTSPVTNHVLLRFFGNNANSPLPSDLQVSLSGGSYSYMVVFKYGSIVTFNIVGRKVDGFLKIIQRHASGLLPKMSMDRQGFCQNEIKYEVREKPNLPMWMQGGLDYIIVQHLNNDGVRVIGSALGQSVALDYYARQVDGLVAEFTDVNRGLVKTGTFNTGGIIKLRKLMRKVALNVVDVDRKLELFKRSEIAWKEDAKYSQMWEYLQDKMELTQRFVGLDFMLRLSELNTEFLESELMNRVLFRAQIVAYPIVLVVFISKPWAHWSTIL